ncbi:hypothetical protein EV183_004391, partial [Coemansia sp. RSA 2336]
MDIGRQTIAMHKNLLAPWAGKRIICIGDYAEDLPENMGIDANLGMDLYSYAQENFKYPKVYSKNALYHILSTAKSDEYFASKHELIEQLLPVPCPMYADKSQSVLLNATTNEYVRQSKILPEYRF